LDLVKRETGSIPPSGMYASAAPATVGELRRII
jgi:hypothetical protein